MDSLGNPIVVLVTVVVVLGLLSVLWESGCLTFIGRRVVAPTVVGFLLYQITGEPTVATGGGIVFSLFDIAINLGTNSV